MVRDADFDELGLDSLQHRSGVVSFDGILPGTRLWNRPRVSRAQQLAKEVAFNGLTRSRIQISGVHYKLSNSTVNKKINLTYEFEGFSGNG